MVSNLLFSSLSTDGDSLAVRRPGNVLDLSRDGMILILENMFLLSGVPDPDLTGYICGDNNRHKDYKQ